MNTTEEQVLEKPKEAPSCACCDDSDENSHKHNESTEESQFSAYLPAIFSFVMLAGGLILDYFDVPFFKGWVPVAWYIAAYIPVGFPVMKQAGKSIKNGAFFTEFLL